MTIKKYICHSYFLELYIIDMNSRYSVYYGRQRDVRVHPEEDTMMNLSEADNYRFCLWVDTVGTYFCNTQEEINEILNSIPWSDYRVYDKEDRKDE